MAAILYRISNHRSARLAAILLVLGALLAGCDSATPDERLQTARELIANNDRPTAIIEMKNGLQDDPDHVELRALLGLTYLETGDPASAEKELRRAVALGSTDAAVRRGLVRSLIQIGRLEDAARRLDEFDDDSDPLMITLRGHLAVARNEPAEAEKYFDRAVHMGESSGDALTGLGQAAWMQNRIGEAGRRYLRATRQAPGFRDAWLGMGEYYLRTAQFDAARTAYEKALELSIGVRNQLMPRLGLARLELARNDAEAARPHLEWARGRFARVPQVNYLEGLRLFQAGDLEAADEVLLSVLQADPNHLPTLYLRASIKAAQEQFGQAIEYMDRVVTQAPDDLSARKYLASLYLRTGDVRKALQTLQPALQAGAGDVQFNTLLGGVLLRLGQPQQAVDALQRAVDLAPQTASLRHLLALAELARDDPEAALKVLDAAAAIDPADQVGVILETLVHLRGGESAAAAGTAQRFAERQPDSAVGHNLNGATALAAGHLSEARAAFERALAEQPDYVPAIINLARVEQRQGDAAAAERRLLSAFDANPDGRLLIAAAELRQREGAPAASIVELLDSRLDRVEAHADELRVALARALVRDGQGARAEAVLEQGGGGGIDAALLLAAIRIANGHAAAAIPDLEALLADHAANIELHYLLGVARQQEGLTTAARNALGEAVLLSDRSHLPALLALARLELGEGNLDAARSLADRASELGAGEPAVLDVSARIAAASGDASRAERLYRDVLARAPSSRRVRDLARHLAANGKRDAAIAVLTDWRQRHTDDTEAGVLLGNLQLDAGHMTAAEAVYRRVLEADPDNVRALNNLAVLEGRRDGERSLEYAERALALAPDDPAVLDTAGWLRVQQGDVDGGVQLLERAVAAAPGVGQIRLHLAVALNEQGLENQALRQLRDAIQADPALAEDAQVAELIARLRG